MLHIIHLPEREDRLATLNKEMAEQKIMEYTLWDGIRDKLFAFRGIRKAHQQIIAYAKKHELPYVTIAEDDIKFLGAGAYEYYLSQIPNPGTFDIFLAGIMNGKILDDNTVKDGYFTGLTLYTMSSRFYDAFLSIRDTGNIDALLRGKGKYIVCNPIVVSQHGGYSDNKERIVKSYDEILKDKNLWKE